MTAVRVWLKCGHCDEPREFTHLVARHCTCPVCGEDQWPPLEKIRAAEREIKSADKAAAAETISASANAAPTSNW